MCRQGRFPPALTFIPLLTPTFTFTRPVPRVRRCTIPKRMLQLAGLLCEQRSCDTCQTLHHTHVLQLSDNCASIAGVTCQTLHHTRVLQLADYCASKAGVVAMHEAIRLEVTARLTSLFGHDCWIWYAVVGYTRSVPQAWRIMPWLATLVVYRRLGASHGH